ncbi:sensor histidine kinase [Rhizobium halophilum]|uniref:sensor histidine kinase n=1 Tax=Rhizobium halophilum TaxID=2846852 RepID=UPI001EFD04CA|nr:ATP-binding protein [Rhizobium halophilum]MCF6371353.1 ATP-binding protein [Rhizobium halophilum]
MEHEHLSSSTPDRTFDENNLPPSFCTLLAELAEAVEGRRAAEEELRETLASMIQHQQVGKCGNFRYNTVTGGIRGTEEIFKIFHFPPGTRSCTVEEWLAKLHADDRDRIARQFFDSLEKREDLRFEYRIVVGAGEMKYIRCDGEPDLEHSGDLTYFGVLTDVTEQRKAEEAQRAMEAELSSALRLASMGELAGAIIHEVNQPLAAIAASAEACRRWMKREPLSGERALASLDRVMEEADRAAAIINGLKSLIHDTIVEPTPFDFGAAVAEVSSLIMGELTRENVMLVTDFALGLPSATGNRVQIQQIVMNLARNAVEAMRSSSRRRVLSVSTGLCEGMLSLRVGDNGPGFDPRDAEHIFSPLFTTKTSGMGLGLSISRKIAIAHGGFLKAEPNDEGGALFHLLLPVRQPL